MKCEKMKEEMWWIICSEKRIAQTKMFGYNTYSTVQNKK